MKALTTLLLFAVLAPGLAAQATAGSQISGTVQDASGAAIAGAQISATQTATGQSRATVAGPDGAFALTNLPVGPYRLAVTAPGFRTYVQTGIVLEVNSNPVINPRLEVGTVAQEVRVSAAAAMAETHETAVSQVIDQKRIVELPLNGRQATQLILLSGGATNAPAHGLKSSKNYSSSVTISVAGGEANGTNYLMDGGDNNDAFSNVNLPFPFPDALQEFSVQTSSMSARYGVHPGAVVNVITKSGTNQWHGDLFEFVRNYRFNAAPAVINAQPSSVKARDSLKRNQFGGTLGGPVLHDKLFLFGGTQITRNRSNPPTAASIAFNPAMLSGDFSVRDSTACGKAIQDVDPATGKPLPGNRIDPNRFNPQALAIVALLPVSSDPCGRVQYGIPSTGDEEQVIGRADWVRNSHHSMFGRYFISDFSDPAVYDGKNLLTSSKPGVLQRSQSAGFSDTYTLSPTAINSFHLTGTRLRINRGPAANLPNPTQLGVKINSLVKNFLTMSVSNGFTVGCGICSPGHFNDNSVQTADDLDLTSGAHQMAFGADWIHNQLNELSNFKSNGTFNFNGTFSKDPLLDFLLGLPNDFSQGNPEEENWRQNYLGLYFQDNYRVSARLSLNGGVRWEPYWPEFDKFGRGNHFDPAAFTAGVKSRVFLNAPPGLFFKGDTQTPAAYTNHHLGNFAPRLGLIYDPAGDGRTSIRASYGLFYDSPEIFYFDRFADSAPFGSSIDLPSPAGGLTNPYQNFPGGEPFPLPFPPTANAFFPTSGIYINLPLNLHPTYTQQWNLSVQHQVGASWLLSATYLGNETSHLWLGNEVNPAVYIAGKSTTGNTNKRRVLYLQNPASGQYYSTMAQTEDGINSSYNGLLLSANHRFSRNFTVLGNYTWSHCISGGNFSGELAGPAFQDPHNPGNDRGACEFDFRHIVNGSFVVAAPQFESPLTERLLGNWQLSGIVGIKSGAPFTVTTNKDNSLTGVGNDRPNLVGDPHVSNPNFLQWFNSAAFSPNAAGTYGNAGRDLLYGPGAFNLDMGLSRRFPIRESRDIELRAEAFNILNHANLAGPHTGLSDAKIGQITGTSGDPRILQFAFKVHF